jgi:Icc-related predicted phosphoesterase
MELVILHVTDVHNALERVEQLKSWLTTRKQRVDVILISGDVADGPMDWSLSDEEVKKHQSDLDAIVAGFTQVRNEVYYIPGNVSTEVESLTCTSFFELMCSLFFTCS